MDQKAVFALQQIQHLEVLEACLCLATLVFEGFEVDTLNCFCRLGNTDTMGLDALSRSQTSRRDGKLEVLMAVQ